MVGTVDKSKYHIATLTVKLYTSYIIKHSEHK